MGSALLNFIILIISRINETFSDILLKKHNFILAVFFFVFFFFFFCCNHTCYCGNMVSVTSASRYITSASRYYPRYQSRSSMYIHGLIPRNFAKLAEAAPIGLGPGTLYLY